MRWAAAAAALPLLGLAAAGCGGGAGGPRVASVAGGVTTAPGSGEADIVEYANCIRSHGVPNFPAPQGGRLSVPANGPVDTSSPQFKQAQQICEKYLPAGSVGEHKRPSAARIAQTEAQLLRFAACVRKHGLPTFPDPHYLASTGRFAFSAGFARFDTNSLIFQRAATVCRQVPAWRRPGKQLDDHDLNAASVGRESCGRVPWPIHCSTPWGVEPP